MKKTKKNHEKSLSLVDQGKKKDSRWGADSDLVRWALFVDVKGIFVSTPIEEQQEDAIEWN